MADDESKDYAEEKEQKESQKREAPGGEQVITRKAKRLRRPGGKPVVIEQLNYLDHDPRREPGPVARMLHADWKNYQSIMGRAQGRVQQAEIRRLRFLQYGIESDVRMTESGRPDWQDRSTRGSLIDQLDDRMRAAWGQLQFHEMRGDVPQWAEDNYEDARRALSDMDAQYKELRKWPHFAKERKRLERKKERRRMQKRKK